jgi:hypothetical protein
VRRLLCGSKAGSFQSLVYLETTQDTSYVDNALCRILVPRIGVHPEMVPVFYFINCKLYLFGDEGQGRARKIGFGRAPSSLRIYLNLITYMYMDLELEPI